MTKYEFIGALREKLRGLPEQEIGDRLNFYGEMIEDLSLRYNRARQSSITQEITEIVAGAEH